MNRIVSFLRSPLTKGFGFRAIGVFALSLGTTLGVIYTNYYNYWEGTIYRTQTVDFNILSNLLSTKLSILLPKAIESGDTSDLQQTLDSNYGLFGIVVTDCTIADVSCPKQKILFASQSTVTNIENGRQKVIPRNDYARIWTQKLEKSESLDQVLANSPYILLYNPPPLHQEWGFQSPREDEKVYFQKNQGAIIGRVYLLRADRPSFVGELQRWLKDIPNGLLIGGAKTRISSRSLVYNSIVTSTFITGLLVLLLMEFAYYLTRVAQQNEAKAVKEKLNAEQKLRTALNRARKANQEKQQAEDLARIAAEKSEQAIREKQQAEETARAINQQAIQEKLKAEEIARIAAEKSEQAIREKQQAEEAARAINQQAIQEKLKAEELARIAAEKSEQAIREKQQAEEAARIAAKKSEQAIREKQQAEEAARIAANEREQARRNEKDLYDAIEAEIKRKTQDFEETIKALQRENNQLRLVSNSPALETMSNPSGRSLLDRDNLVYFELTETDFYPSERRDLILDILKNVNNIRDNSRRYHLWQDLVGNNTPTGRREDLKNEIHTLFREYRKMDTQMQNTLERMGFEIISEKNHYKIRFGNDNRYVVTFAKTSSDHRAGMNIARDICNLLL